MRSPKFAFPLTTRFFLRIAVPILGIVCLLVVYKPSAHAVPSYSRQTGMPCTSCHYIPPDLTPFGRQFKLDGYVLTTKPEITDEKTDRNPGLNILEAFPLSVIFFTSFTSTKSPQPNAENGNFQFPQAASLFLAGSWGDHVGSFAQVTYSSSANHFSWDNTDVRYANNNLKLFGKGVSYGVTFNNNPTVEDLWNSTPAWGFPFQMTNVAPSPSAVAVINGRLAQDVAGLGGYAMWNNHLYIASTIYRSEHLGGPQPNPGTGFGINIRGIAPYWRVAWQTTKENNDWVIGTYGMHLKSSPNTVVGPTNGYTDWAIDFQYNRTLPQLKNDVLTFRGTYIRENSSLNASFAAGGAALVPHHLNTVQTNVQYHFGSRFEATGAFFNITGTADPLLYAQAPVFGSASGSPSSTGYIVEGSWWPRQNFKFGAQYTGYTRFNGQGTNYDGAGRKASANNSIYLIALFTF